MESMESAVKKMSRRMPRIRTLTRRPADFLIDVESDGMKTHWKY